MWRALFANRIRRRSGFGYAPYRRRSYFGPSFRGALLAVCLVVVLGLYLTGHLQL